MAESTASATRDQSGVGMRQPILRDEHRELPAMAGAGDRSTRCEGRAPSVVRHLAGRSAPFRRTASPHHARAAPVPSRTTSSRHLPPPLQTAPAPLRPGLARPQHPAYIGAVPGLPGAMDINALVIIGSDPGAVPGGSTKSRIGGSWGRNRIDGRPKGLALSRRGATVIGPQSTVANNNRAPAMALAA